MLICVISDKSYCGSHEKICPPNRTCLNMIGGRYLCKENEVLQNSINVVIAVDKSVLPAVLPLLLSIKEHNKESSLLIHVVISDEDRKELEKLIYCGFSIPDNIQVCPNNYNVSKYLVIYITFRLML